MKLTSLLCAATVACCVFRAATSGEPVAQPEPQFTAEQIEFFERDIRPLLADKCLHCHGNDVQENDLRLDSREALLTGGERGPAAVANNPDESLLIRAVSHRDEKLKMPPDERLSDEDVAKLVRWIELGAPWPAETAARYSHEIDFEVGSKFWSFRPLVKPQPPAVENDNLVRTPIDSFVLARLERKGLQWVSPADKRTLLRRASYDLIGLPPTPAEIDDFLNDNSPDAFAKVIDRLLASPHYGERWARYWLDVCRYGETDAASDVNPYKVIFRYRDWVIQAFNDDIPFDQFVRMQLAGDKLDDIDPVQGKIALGYLGMLPLFNKPGADKCPVRRKEVRADELDNQIDMVCKSMLGLTVTCARCHDHKFDPIPTEDYYALAGIFWSSKEVPDLEVAPGVTIRTYQDAEPEDVRVYIRGNIRDQGDVVPRRFLKVLAGEDAPRFTEGSGRRELAEAMVSTPLTWRVMANRIWLHHFGRGIVDTPNNFGKTGTRPTHPELLEWLAARLRERGSFKDLHREIMLSAVYQLSSSHHDEYYAQDSDNRFLWRMSRRRLDFEAHRDALLYVTGELLPVVGGDSIDPRDNATRRSVYTEVHRFVRSGDYHTMDFLFTFDFPNPRISVGKRIQSTVPQQELFLLNSDFIAERARRLYSHIKRQTEDDGQLERIRLAYETLYGRPADDEELQLALEFLEAVGGSDEKLAAEAQLMLTLLAANEFQFVD